MNKYLIVFILLLPLNVLAAGGYEKIHQLKANEQLPAKILKTDYYQIDPIVKSNGFLNIYTIKSEFGDYQVTGNLSLLALLRELYALQELKNLSKTKVFAEAAANSATGSVEAMFHIATNPVSTVKGIPGGVSRLFKRTKDIAGAVYDGGKDMAGEAADSVTGKKGDEAGDNGDGQNLGDTAVETTGKAADWYFGVTAGQRKWAKKLGVDPYTRNELLQNALREVAKIDRAGSFAVMFAPIPRIPGSNYINLANDAIWNLSYEELLEQNIAQLTEIGFSEATIKKFLKNQSFSPLMQTYLIAAVLQLENVKNRNILIELASTKETEDFARFYLETVILLTWFNSQKVKLSEIKSFGEIPYSIDEKNRLILLLPVDYLFWTKELAKKAEELTNNIKNENQSERDAIFLGDISQLSESGMKKLGWIVEDELNESTKQFRDKYLQVIE
ncbi:MAG: hypothetical protein ACR2NW_03215 [Thermodesulfobacteriota bacterium]